MGADIHCYAEKRVDGKWVSVGESYEEDGETCLDQSASITNGRDYGLFGLLSEVRREWGLRIIPDADMCVPEDASAEVQAEYKRGEGDWHTPGWLNWQTLLDAQKEINIKLLLGQIDPNAKDGIAELMESFQRDANEYNLNVREMRIILWYDN